MIKFCVSFIQISMLEYYFSVNLQYTYQLLTIINIYTNYWRMVAINVINSNFEILWQSIIALKASINYDKMILSVEQFTLYSIFSYLILKILQCNWVERIKLIRAKNDNIRVVLKYIQVGIRASKSLLFMWFLDLLYLIYFYVFWKIEKLTYRPERVLYIKIITLHQNSCSTHSTR